MVELFHRVIRLSRIIEGNNANPYFNEDNFLDFTILKINTKIKAINIETKKVEKNKIPFVGISGLDLSQSTLSKIEKLLDQKSVLVTHVPPQGLQDKVFLGMHAGSKELREITDKYKPRLVLCGHIHEDPGFTKTDKTIVVNCSMGKRGEGALIEIDKEISVKMLD